MALQSTDIISTDPNHKFSNANPIPHIVTHTHTFIACGGRPLTPVTWLITLFPQAYAGFFYTAKALRLNGTTELDVFNSTMREFCHTNKEMVSWPSQHRPLWGQRQVATVEPEGCGTKGGVNSRPQLVFMFFR